MFGKRIQLFRVFGFSVSLDLSWLLLAVLITWSLAVGVFPAVVPDLPVTTYWWMGAAGALGLFLSVVLHELSHSMVARRYGIPMHGITLFIFGGVAEMSGEPATPKSEFAMAIAGPAASVVLGGLFFALSALARLFSWPATMTSVISYLAVINVILAVFNLIPAFPLDGGRVLRSVLWHVKGDLTRATRTSSAIGAGFGVAMIVLGLVSLISGSVIGGIWWFLIGMFLYGAARGSYQQLLMRQTFEGVPIRSLMHGDPISVPRGTSVARMVEEFVYRHHHKMFPVVDGDHLWGCVTTRDIRQLPREEWANQTVGSISRPCGPENTIGPAADAMQAAAAMKRSGSSRLMVVEGDHLVGIVSLKDLFELLSVKMELQSV
jgi:Zn-dependent protease/CBS domain-containing protein